MTGQQTLVASTGVLAATVRMVKQARRWLAVTDGHLECLGGQGVRQERFHGPANHHTNPKFSAPNTKSPVSPGLKKLSPSLKHFVDVFELDPFLIQAAAKTSETPTSAKRMNYSKLVARLPRAESNVFLAALAEGKPGVASALRKRLLALSPKQKPTRTKITCTLRQLLQRAQELAQYERKLQAEETRQKHVAEMTVLAAREEQARGEVDHLLDHGGKIASVYDDTTVRLKKLEQLSEFQNTEQIFQRRIRALGKKYANRHALIRRWKNQGWV